MAAIILDKIIPLTLCLVSVATYCSPCPLQAPKPCLPSLEKAQPPSGVAEALGVQGTDSHNGNWEFYFETTIIPSSLPSPTRYGTAYRAGNLTAVPRL